MKKKPKITILLATYNRAHLIGETLESISAQTYMHWECIIVDDFSTDSTFDVVKSYINKDNRIHYYLKTEKYKRGLSGTRNYGLDLARERRSKYIQFFDDDDLMHPKKLELQIGPFFSSKSLDLTICQYRKFDSLEVVNFNLNNCDDGLCKIETDDLLKSFFLNLINLNSPGPLWKASTIMKYRFNEDLFYAEEREFYLRIFLNEKISYKPIKFVLFWYRKHSLAITSGLYKENTNEIKRKSEDLFKEVFLSEVLKKNKAEFFILKSYAVRAFKDNKIPHAKKIAFYILNKRLYFNHKYLALLIYIKLYLKKVNQIEI